MATNHVIDNEKLIGAMEARPALWQSKHPEHRNRFKKGVLWDEVAAAVLPGAPAADAGKQTYPLDCSAAWRVLHCFRSEFSFVLFALAVRCLQKRWKYLRDRYRRVSRFDVMSMRLPGTIAQEISAICLTL